MVRSGEGHGKQWIEEGQGGVTKEVIRNVIFIVMNETFSVTLPHLNDLIKEYECGLHNTWVSVPEHPSEVIIEMSHRGGGFVINVMHRHDCLLPHQLPIHTHTHNQLPIPAYTYSLCTIYVYYSLHTKIYTTPYIQIYILLPTYKDIYYSLHTKIYTTYSLRTKIYTTPYIQTAHF